jgi:hypothetical protein
VILKGKIMGIRMTTKLFAFSQNDLTVMITQQCPDEDLKHVQNGLTLIENSFSLITDEKKDAPNKPDAGDGK